MVSRIPIDILMLLLGSIHEPGRTIPWAVSESLTEGPRLLDPRTRLDLQLLVEVRARNCTLERGPSCWWPVIQFQKFLDHELQRVQPCLLDINPGPQEQQIRVHLPYVSCNRVEVYLALFAFTGWSYLFFVLRFGARCVQGMRRSVPFVFRSGVTVTISNLVCLTILRRVL